MNTLSYSISTLKNGLYRYEGEGVLSIIKDGRWHPFLNASRWPLVIFGTLVNPRLDGINFTLTQGFVT